MHIPKPLLLLIFDGWGYSESTEHNAIAAATTLTWDALWEKYPHMLIDASGTAVGLPDAQMGNSEVGHMHIGAGRVIYQDLTRIDKAIEDGSFNQNAVILSALAAVNRSSTETSSSALHILGLLSPGGVHSHERHIHAMLKLAAETRVKKIYIHVFLDGRDTPPQSAMSSLEALEDLCQELSAAYTTDIRIVSLIGRYYAMDRDKRWDRTQAAFDLLVNGQAVFHTNSVAMGLTLAYTRGETDEFVQATAIHERDEAPITVQSGDGVICMNFRNDRMRQLVRAFMQEDFSGFARSYVPQLSTFVTLTHYADDIKANVAFPSVKIVHGLGEWLAIQHKTQLRIAETEKYAHVTFFFNGGQETAFPNEDRILIASPQVATYDLQPAMSAVEITDKLVTAILEKKYDFIACNFANADMVGHTGNFAATLQAIQVLDECLARIIEALQTVGGEALITADHGNAEMMYDAATQQAHTAHTNFVVPLLYVGTQGKFTAQVGTLVDIAPTVLSLLNLPVPAEMTGKILLK